MKLTTWWVEIFQVSNNLTKIKSEFVFVVVKKKTEKNGEQLFEINQKKKSKTTIFFKLLMNSNFFFTAKQANTNGLIW